MFPLGQNRRGRRTKTIPYFDPGLDPVKLPPAERRAAYAELRGLGIPGYAVRKYLKYPSQHTVGQRLEAMPATRAACAKLQERLGIFPEDVLEGLIDALNVAATPTELLACWVEIARFKGFLGAAPCTHRNPRPKMVFEFPR